MSKQNKEPPPPHATYPLKSKLMEFIVLANYSWPALEYGWYRQWQIHWRGEPRFSFSLQVSIVNSFLVSSRALCLLAFWDLAGLTVQGLFVLPQSLWVPMRISPLMSARHCFFGVTHYLSLILFLPPLLQRSLRFEGRGLMNISCLGLSDPKSLMLGILYSCRSLC